MSSLSLSPDKLYWQSPNCLINSLHKYHISYHVSFVGFFPNLQMAKIRPQQMPESTRNLQNRVILAVCSHTNSCLIRFDNQKMTAVLTLLSFWQICFSEAVWRLWLQKSLKICLGFWGLWQEGLWVFIELSKSHSVDSKPESVLMFGLSGSNMAAVWLQRLPLWCGCEGIFLQGKAGKTGNRYGSSMQISLVYPQLAVFVLAFEKVIFLYLNTCIT